MRRWRQGAEAVVNLSGRDVVRMEAAAAIPRRRKTDVVVGALLSRSAIAAVPGLGIMADGGEDTEEAEGGQERDSSQT